MWSQTESSYARPLLRSKLHLPRAPAATVHRREVLDRLQGGLDRALTLISAPAGSGKTTLLSTWLAGQSCLAIWISLDPSDSQLTTFLYYFVAAIQTVAPGFGHATLGLLSLPQLPPVDYVSATLLDELAALSEEAIVVIDDYHAIQDPSISALVS